MIAERYAQGDTYKAIAEALHIAPSTVRTHLGAIYRKLEVSNKTALARVLQQPGQPTISLPDKPSIAVLPFNNLSGDPTRDYFSDGITEDIITNLSKFPELFVIARHSTFTYKRKPISISQVGCDLGVRYVLKGSIQQAGNTVRITVQLVEAVTEHHLWAERYDGALEKVFAFQDEVAQSIAATMMGEESGALRRAETARSLRKDPDSLDAYDYLLRGTEHYLCENVVEARQNFEKAIALDTGYAAAYKMLAWTYANLLFRQRSEEPRNDLQLAYTWAQKALTLDNSDYGTHWVLGIIHMFRHDYDRSRAALLRARELNPNSAGLLATLGDATMYFGQPEDAIDCIKSAMRLNPHYPDRYVWALGNAYDTNGQLELAIRELKKIENPSFGILLDLAALYARAGSVVGAEETVQAILELKPEFSLKAFSAIQRQMSWEKDPAADDEYIDALRRVGLPE